VSRRVSSRDSNLEDITDNFFTVLLAKSTPFGVFDLIVKRKIESDVIARQRKFRLTIVYVVHGESLSTSAVGTQSEARSVHLLDRTPRNS
jgi:hypothetical protein